MSGELNPVRRAAQQALNGCAGAFVRCDRGEGLYVTNAPQRTGNALALCEGLQRAGFMVEEQGGLWRLTPREGLVRALTAWLEGEEQSLYLPAWQDRAEQLADWALLWEGIKRLEMPGDRAALVGYEKKLRQRAALCLRTGAGGGMLPLCGQLLSRIEREYAQ